MRVAEIKAVLRPELGADEWHAKGFASRPHPQSLLPPDQEAADGGSDGLRVEEIGQLRVVVDHARALKRSATV